jgi:hypothetical protein
MEFVQLAVLVFFFTIVCIISGVSEEEMPEDEFMVVEIEGVSQNGHMSVGDRMPGYLFFIRKDASADRFFAWYYKSIIVLPTNKEVREMYGLPKQEEVVLYLDSDSPNLENNSFYYLLYVRNIANKAILKYD